MKTYYNLTDKSGFEFLHDYFSNLPKEKSLGTDKKGNYIVDISWFFSKDLPTEIIEKAVTNIIKSYNPNYERNSLYKNKNPEKVAQVLIHAYHEELSFIFVGADGFSKLRVMDTVPEDIVFTIPTIDLKKLEYEIMDVCDELNIREAKSSGIMTNLNVACKNLVAYYDGLIELKKQHLLYSCTIEKNKSENTKTKRRDNTKPRNIPLERKNEEIPFEKRKAILESHNPSAIVFVNERDEDGTPTPNAYITYVYTDLLKSIPGQKHSGYLFISEPYEYNREARIFFVDKNEFEKIEKKDFGSKLESITKSYLEMPTEEFLKQGNMKLYHTSLETYTDRINFFITGEKSKNVDNNMYQPRLQALYKDPSLQLPYYKPRATPKDIAKLGELSNTGKVDRTAQMMITKQHSHTQNLSKQ